MKKIISIMIAALMSAASVAQVNPKINQLFEELKQTKGALYPTTPSIMKRGGLDANGNRPSLDYSLPIYYRPDLIRGRKDSLFVDSILRADKACFDKRVKAIRRTISEMQKEAQDSLHYESHTNGKDTIVCSLNFCRDTTRVHKYSDDKFSYFYSDEFLDFVLESGKQEGTFEGRFRYTVTLPGIDLSSNTYSWGDMIDDIESLMSKHSISHRNSFWQHDDAYSHAVWDDDESEDRKAWMNIVNYGEYAYAGVTEAKIYSLTEDQKQLAQQLLAAIDSMALRFTNSRQSRYYEYHYGASFERRPSIMLAVFTRHISETSSIQVRAANHGYHFLILNTRGAEWIPTEWFCLKSFINGKKTYFEGMAPKE